MIGAVGGGATGSCFGSSIGRPHFFFWVGCADRSCSGGGRSCGGPLGRTLWSHAEKPATPSAILPDTAATASAVATALSTALPTPATVDETLSAVFFTFSGMAATAS